MHGCWDNHTTRVHIQRWDRGKKSVFVSNTIFFVCAHLNRRARCDACYFVVVVSFHKGDKHDIWYTWMHRERNKCCDRMLCNMYYKYRTHYRMRSYTEYIYSIFCLRPYFVFLVIVIFLRITFIYLSPNFHSSHEQSAGRHLLRIYSLWLHVIVRAKSMIWSSFWPQGNQR